MSGSISERLTRLETSARRWRLATVCLAAIAGAGVLMGQIRIGGGAGGITAPLITVDKVVCKTLSVVNAENNERANLSVDTDENINFVLKDKEGQKILSLQATADHGGTIRITTAKNKPLATLATDAKDRPTFTLTDAEGKKLFSAP